MFGKSERKKRKIPTILGLSLGALATVGVIRIRNKSLALFQNMKCKIKSAFKKKSEDAEDFFD